jgi:hypothetical protein
VFKSQDVPARVDPNWNGDGKALHCFDWTSSNVFDFATGQLKTTEQIDPYCLAPRDSPEEKENDAVISQNVQKALPPDFQLEGHLTLPAWQPQLSVDSMQTIALPAADVKAAVSGSLFEPIKGFEYRPLFHQIQGLVKKVNLNFLVEAGTKWDGDAVMAEQLRRVTEIFSQCGVEMEFARVYTAKFKPQAQKMLRVPTNPYAAPPNAALLRYVHLPRPLGFLYGSENTQGIYAVNKASADLLPQRASMLNTVWLSEVAVQHLGPIAWNQGYVALAHELAHVLGNFDHTYFRDPNLMSSAFVGTIAKSGDLTPGQCEAIRTFGIAQ